MNNKTIATAKSTANDKFRTPKISELVAKELRRQIIRGEIEPGANLPPESELMEKFDIARPTLREALRILESESLISVRRGARGGPTVHLPDPEIAARHFGLLLQSRKVTTIDLFRVYQLIQPPAVRLVIENSSEEAEAVLTELHKEEEKALLGQDIGALAQSVSRFHSTLIDLTKNQTLILMMRMLESIYENQIYKAPDGGFDRKSAADHTLSAQRRLIQLIKKERADEAVKFWRQHLNEVEAILASQSWSENVVDTLE
ncbi:FadR family transcriptional regulator [Spongiibacter sp. KMU-166]|uniref:FadR family transcriptional regulator n=1 Tax=Spongiibacter thalassae TaxID=2721624 RepID=A0ABX1GCK7_9GAMM|nr:GntR family transcriptional regulator [Spongiibacter thalassae]NKI15999.1 FadR family transcriptional regulator [Spongiibacter thalassae]